VRPRSAWGCRVDAKRRSTRLRAEPAERLGADLGSLLCSSLASSRVFCENDANCAAVAEHEWGAGRGVDDFVMVTLGTGIGGGIIADGKLLQGRSGFAARSATWSSKRTAFLVPVGYGLLERYASGSGLRA